MEARKTLTLANADLKPETRISITHIDQLLRAETKTKNLIYDAKRCRNIFTNLISYFFIFAAINNCAIYVIPGYRDALSSRAPEDVLSRNGLLILSGIFLLLALFPHAINYCSRNIVPLNKKQKDKLKKIIESSELPTQVVLDPVEIKKLIVLRKEVLISLNELNLFKNKKSFKQDVPQLIFEYCFAPADAANTYALVHK